MSDKVFQESLVNFIEGAKELGWVAAGAYYWTISRYAERQNKILAGEPEAIRPDKAEIFDNFNTSHLFNAANFGASSTM